MAMADSHVDKGSITQGSKTRMKLYEFMIVIWTLFTAWGFQTMWENRKIRKLQMRQLEEGKKALQEWKELNRRFEKEVLKGDKQ
jgi:hypothetical protein